MFEVEREAIHYKHEENMAVVTCTARPFKLAPCHLDGTCWPSLHNGRPQSPRLFTSP